jgi:hypothetical protein
LAMDGENRDQNVIADAGGIRRQEKSAHGVTLSGQGDRKAPGIGRRRNTGKRRYVQLAKAGLRQKLP